MASRGGGKLYYLDSIQTELGAIPLTLQALTGVSFTNSQTFGSGTVENEATGDQNITGVSFTNSQSFAAGTIANATPKAITGASFTNSQSFGTGTVSQPGGDQDIIGVSFTNTQTFGSGSVTADGYIDIDGVLPRFDRRTLKKLKKKFSEYTYQEKKDREFKRKVREAIESAAQGEPKQESQKVEAQPEIERKEALPISTSIPQIDIDWGLFDNVLKRLEIASLQRQRLMLLKQKERQEAIAQYEALVTQAFEQAYQQHRKEKNNKIILDMMLHLILDD